jgi:hypothetical protein
MNLVHQHYGTASSSILPNVDPQNLLTLHLAQGHWHETDTPGFLAWAAPWFSTEKRGRGVFPSRKDPGMPLLHYPNQSKVLNEEHSIG